MIRRVAAGVAPEEMVEVTAGVAAEVAPEEMVAQGVGPRRPASRQYRRRAHADSPEAFALLPVGR